MTVQLPEELAGDIRAEVLKGRFATEDEAVAEAVRDYFGRRSPSATVPGSGSIGAMRDDADLLERITQDIMESRLSRTLRLASDE